MMLRPCFSCEFADPEYFTKDDLAYGCNKEFGIKAFVCLPEKGKYHFYKKASPEKRGELAIYRFKGISIEDVS